MIQKNISFKTNFLSSRPNILLKWTFKICQKRYSILICMLRRHQDSWKRLPLKLFEDAMIPMFLEVLQLLTLERPRRFKSRDNVPRETDPVTLTQAANAT